MVLSVRRDGGIHSGAHNKILEKETLDPPQIGYNHTGSLLYMAVYLETMHGMCVLVTYSEISEPKWILFANTTKRTVPPVREKRAQVIAQT